MRKIKLYLILAIIVFSACDPVFLAEIVNETDKEVILKVKFNKNYLEQLYKDQGLKNNSIPFLESYPNWTNLPPALNFDTINFIKTYRIEPRESFPLRSGIGNRPDFNLIQEVTIIGSDSIYFKNKEEIINGFNIKKGRHWILKVE